MDRDCETKTCSSLRASGRAFRWAVGGPRDAAEESLVALQLAFRIQPESALLFELSRLITPTASPTALVHKQDLKHYTLALLHVANSIS